MWEEKGGIGCLTHTHGPVEALKQLEVHSTVCFVRVERDSRQTPAFHMHQISQHHLLWLWPSAALFLTLTGWNCSNPIFTNSSLNHIFSSTDVAAQTAAAEIPQLLSDGLSRTTDTHRAPRMTLQDFGDPQSFPLWRHHEVDICGLEWNIRAADGGSVRTQSCINKTRKKKWICRQETLTNR